MALAAQQQQAIPVQMHQTDDRLVVTAPMPGLEPEDISVCISGAHVTIRGDYRGSRHDQPEALLSEWTAGPYYRELVLPQPVDGALTNATYGNGVLVLSMPKRAFGTPGTNAEFRLEALEGPRGQRVGHTGSDMQPTTTQEKRQRQGMASRRTGRA
jgi:HSP20 family protein